MVYAASFQPPAVTGTASSPPAWVLLDTRGYIADNDNATRAEALTSTGHTIAVSFFSVEPPGVSHFCVHCPGLKASDFAAEPRVVCSADNLALLSLTLTDGPTSSYDDSPTHEEEDSPTHEEFFLYRATKHGRPQSLEPLPGFQCHLSKILYLGSTVVVPCGGDDGEHFVLADLGLTFRTTREEYEFHVFRSELGTWTEKTVVLGQAELGPNMPIIVSAKVILLGGGEVGWVDLWNGILVCNVLDEDPAFRAIPLPRLLPANHVYKSDGSSPEQFRDVVCVGGVIKFVEMEYCRRRIVREIPDVSKLEVLHDEDLTVGEAAQTEEDTYEYTGWRMVTWNRTVSSGCWRRGGLVHVDDVVVGDPRHSVLPPCLVEKEARKGIQTGFPTLSIDGGDLVYLKAKVSTTDRNAWVVAIDTRKKTVVGVAPFSDERSMYTHPNYTSYLCPVKISKYTVIYRDTILPPPFLRCLALVRKLKHLIF